MANHKILSRPLLWGSSHPINQEKIRRTIIVVGASAGGVVVLKHLFSTLPSSLAASILVTIHRAAAPGELATVLATRSLLPVIEVARETGIEQSTIYLAPADHHLIVRKNRLAIERGPKEHGTRPAVDPLLRSAAIEHGPRVVGLIMTGCGDDGVAGMVEVKKHGGICLVQNPAEAYMPSMPNNAIQHDHVDQILPVANIVPVLTALANGEEVKVHPASKKLAS